MDLRLEKQGEPKELIATICRKLGVSREMLAGVVASPPCVSYTKLDHVSRERGNNYREANKPYPPRKLDGSLKAQLKRKIAQEHDDMVMNLLQSITLDHAEGYQYDFCIENPAGLMRHRPFMMGDAWLQVSHLSNVDYCAFNHDYMKTTDLWHSFGGHHTFKGTTGDGRCHRRCGAGRYKANGRFSHYKRHAGEAGTGVTGPDQMLQKWQIPHLLCEEVVSKMKPKNDQKTILDLFSGGESYRNAVESAGYTYVPVDIKTLASDTESGSTAHTTALQHEHTELS